MFWPSELTEKGYRKRKVKIELDILETELSEGDITQKGYEKKKKKLESESQVPNTSGQESASTSTSSGLLASGIASQHKTTNEALQALFGIRSSSCKASLNAYFNPSQLSSAKKNTKSLKKGGKKKVQLTPVATSSTGTTGTGTTSSNVAAMPTPKTPAPKTPINPPRLICPKPVSPAVTSVCKNVTVNKPKCVDLDNTLLFVIQQYSEHNIPPDEETYDDPVSRGEVTVKDTDTLLGIGLNAYWWVLWREFTKLPPVKTVSNFYHLSLEEMKNYDSFEAVIKQCYKNGSILLPYVIEIQEYVKKKGITLYTSTLFDVEVTDFPLSEIDLFIEFVNEKNRKSYC